MNEIIMVDIDQLSDHPAQYELYGEPDIDKEFLASIKERGILQPLIITEPADIQVNVPLRWVIIAGHRRKAAAQIAGHGKIPCILKKYKSPELAELDLVFTNINREKTNTQRRAEYLHAKQKISQITKIKQLSGFMGGTNYANEELGRILLKYKIDPEKPLNAIEILKDVTGYSEYEQKFNNLVFGDGFENFIEMLRKKGVTPEGERAIYAQWKIAREAYDKGSSMHEVMSAIKDLKTKCLAQYEKPVKKPRQPRATKPVQSEESILKDMEDEVIIMSHTEFLGVDCKTLNANHSLKGLHGVGCTVDNRYFWYFEIGDHTLIKYKES